VCVAAVLVVGALLFWVAKTYRNTQKRPLGSADNQNDNLEKESFLSFDRKVFHWEQKLKEDGSSGDFDLFTGPSVFMENGKLLMKTYDMLLVDDAFPLYLSEIKMKPYRLKIEGYSKSKDDAIVVMLRDTEADKYEECVVGQKSEMLKIRLKHAEIQQQEKDGVAQKIPMIRIYDELLRKEFVLTSEQKFLDGEYIITVKDMGGKEYVFHEAGDSVRIGEALCILRSFSKKDGSARLLLKGTNGQEFNKIVHLIR
jgi:hypothetical protein